MTLPHPEALAVAPITEGMTEPTCKKCGHSASDHSGPENCTAPACNCPETSVSIYRQALAEAQADSAKLREAVEAYALDPDAATHFLNINPERDEPFADALLRWHASRQPDPAPGGTENG